MLLPHQFDKKIAILKNGVVDIFTGTAILPESLLELITTWVTDSPLLCIEHITNRLPHVPSFYTPVKQQTHPDILYLSNRGPIAGLVHCCVIAPLLIAQTGTPMDTGNPLEEPTKSKMTSTRLMFSKLFLGILQSMLFAQAELARLKYIRCPEMITVESIKRMVQNLTKLVQQKHMPIQSEEVQLSLDRFAQAIQVALATGMIHSSRGMYAGHCKVVGKFSFSRGRSRAAAGSTQNFKRNRLLGDA